MTIAHSQCYCCEKVCNSFAITLAAFGFKQAGVHVVLAGAALPAAEVAAVARSVVGVVLAVCKTSDCVNVAEGPNMVQMAFWSKICCSCCRLSLYLRLCVSANVLLENAPK